MIFDMSGIPNQFTVIRNKIPSLIILTPVTTIITMIKKFKHKILKRLFEFGQTAGVNPRHTERLKILALLEAAESLGVTRKTLSGLLNSKSGLFMPFILCIITQFYVHLSPVLQCVNQ